MKAAGTPQSAGAVIEARPHSSNEGLLVPLAKTPLKLGIVGCGSIAGYLHAPAIAQSSRCKLSALVDSDTNRALDLGRQYGSPFVGQSIASIAQHVDAVVLATPPQIRCDLVEEALQCGLHVLCEKPLANTVAECEAIRELSQKYRRIVGVCHQFRFWPNRVSVQRRLQDGRLPPPQKVVVSQGTLYSWNTVSGYTVRRDMVPGGVLINAGTHPMDTLISWFGDPVEFEYADDSCGGLESNVRMMAQFANAIPCEFRLSRTSTLANTISLYWNDLSITMTNNDPFRLVEERPGTGAETIQCGPSSKGYLQPAIDLYDDFVQALVSQSRPQVDAEEGTRVIKWVEACYAQKRTRAMPLAAPLPGQTW